MNLWLKDRGMQIYWCKENAESDKRPTIIRIPVQEPRMNLNAVVRSSTTCTGVTGRRSCIVTTWPVWGIINSSCMWPMMMIYLEPIVIIIANPNNSLIIIRDKIEKGNNPISNKATSSKELPSGTRTTQNRINQRKKEKGLILLRQICEASDTNTTSPNLLRFPHLSAHNTVY